MRTAIPNTPTEWAWFAVIVACIAIAVAAWQTATKERDRRQHERERRDWTLQRDDLVRRRRLSETATAELQALVVATRKVAHSLILEAAAYVPRSGIGPKWRRRVVDAGYPLSRDKT